MPKLEVDADRPFLPAVESWRRSAIPLPRLDAYCTFYMHRYNTCECGIIIIMQPRYYTTHLLAIVGCTPRIARPMLQRAGNNVFDSSRNGSSSDLDTIVLVYIFIWRGTLCRLCINNLLSRPKKSVFSLPTNDIPWDGLATALLYIVRIWNGIWDMRQHTKKVD